MTSRHCLRKKHCWDKGTCETCDFGVASMDGSRVLYDKEHLRTEITITATKGEK